MALAADSPGGERDQPCGTGFAGMPLRTFLGGFRFISAVVEFAYTPTPRRTRGVMYSNDLEYRRRAPHSSLIEREVEDVVFNRHVR